MNYADEIKINYMHSHHFDEMGFREHEKIGEGAFGQVFKGIYRGEEAAVKVFEIRI